VHGGDSGKGVPKIRAGVIALPTTTNSTQAAGRHLAVGLCSLAIGYWLLAIGYWLLAYFYKIMLLAHQLLHSLELLSLVCGEDGVPGVFSN
jgi:hypothetical protein